MKEGKFPATVIRHEMTVAGTGNKGIYFRLAVDFDGEQEEVGYTLWLTDGTLRAGIVGRTLRAMGFDYRKTSIEVLGEEEFHLAGREVSVLVGEEEDNRTGEMRLRIKFVNPPKIKMEKREYDDLTEQIRRFGSSGNEAAPGSGDEENGDNIPF